MQPSAVSVMFTLTLRGMSPDNHCSASSCMLGHHYVTLQPGTCWGSYCCRISDISQQLLCPAASGWELQFPAGHTCGQSACQQEHCTTCLEAAGRARQHGIQHARVRSKGHITQPMAEQDVRDIEGCHNFGQALRLFKAVCASQRAASQPGHGTGRLRVLRGDYRMAARTGNSNAALYAHQCHLRTENSRGAAHLSTQPQ